MPTLTHSVRFASARLQLEQQHRTRGITLQQLWYFLQPAARSLETLDQIVISVGSSRGGALLKALHERCACP